MADVERARKRNNIILGVVMIVLLVGSSLGYSLMSGTGGNKNEVSEMGFDFVRDGGMWKTLIDGEIFAFRYLPSELSDVEVNLSPRDDSGEPSVELDMYSRQPLYFVNQGEGVGDILANLDRYILRYQEACFGNESICEGDLPVKDCNSNLIIFIEENETSVYREDNCVFIVGDVSRGSDAFLYEVLGIR